MRQTYLLIAAATACLLAGTWLLTSSTDAVRESPAGKAAKGNTRFSAPAMPAHTPQGLGSHLAAAPPMPSAEPADAPALPATPSFPPLPPEVVERARGDFRKMVAKRTRTDLSSASFFQKLSPDKQSQLVETIVQNETALMQFLTEAAEKREILSEADLQSLRADGESAIKSVLGESEYAEYQQHAASSPDRIILSQTTEVLGKPLAEPSSRALSTLLAEERGHLVRVPPQGGQDPSRSIAAMAERINARAAAVLASNEEREALQQVLSRLVEGASKKQVAAPAAAE